MKRLVITLAVLLVFFSAGYALLHTPKTPTSAVVVEPDYDGHDVSVNDFTVAEKTIPRTPKHANSQEKSTEINYDIDSIWVYETETGKIVHKIQVGSKPTSLVLSPNGFWLYALNTGSQSISVIDAEKGVIVKTITVPDEPRAMALSSDGAYLAVSTYTGIFVFETHNFDLIAQMITGKKPAGLAFTPYNKYLLVTNQRDNSLEKLNFYTQSSFGLTYVGSDPVAVDITSNNHAFVANTGSNGVSVVDIADMSMAKKYEIPAGEQPAAIKIDPPEKFVYVANKKSNSVSVIHQETYKPYYTISTGLSPVALAYNVFSPPAGAVYTANSGSNDISIIDVSKKEEIARWKTGSNPSSLVVSPDGKWLFVAMKGKYS